MNDHFHASFLNEAPDGLWPVGTYWHLETRPDENLHVRMISGAVATDFPGNPLDLNRPDSTFMNHRGVFFASDAALASRHNLFPSWVGLPVGSHAAKIYG